MCLQSNLPRYCVLSTVDSKVVYHNCFISSIDSKVVYHNCFISSVDCKVVYHNCFISSVDCKVDSTRCIRYRLGQANIQYKYDLKHRVVHKMTLSKIIRHTVYREIIFTFVKHRYFIRHYGENDFENKSNIKKWQPCKGKNINPRNSLQSIQKSAQECFIAIGFHACKSVFRNIYKNRCNFSMNVNAIVTS